MRLLVEDAGDSWCSGRFGMWRNWTGAASGTQAIGWRHLLWKMNGKLVVVAHQDASGEPVSYPVPTATTPTPYAGARLWWLCPACGRRGGVLDLPADRDRLSCRSCCGLGYASQYPRARAKFGCRRSVPVLTLTTTVLNWAGGRASKSEQVKTFGPVG